MNFAKYRVQLSTEKKSTRVSMSTSMSTPSLVTRMGGVMGDLNIVTNYRQVSCANNAGFKSYRLTNSYKPSFLFVGHRQIMQILNRCRRR